MSPLVAHARNRAQALLRQADDERAFASDLAYDGLPREQKLLLGVRFRVRHLRHLARLWLAFAGDVR